MPMNQEGQHWSTEGVRLSFPNTNWVAVCLYLGVTGIFVAYTQMGIYHFSRPSLSASVIVLGICILLALDRLEYLYQTQDTEPSRSILALLQLLRAIVIVGVSYNDGLGSIFSAVLLPLIFFTFFFFNGRSYGLTGLVWMLYLVMRVHIYTNSYNNTTGLYNGGDITRDFIFLLILLFILAMTYQAKRERANRLRVERLLQELKKSHQQLQDYADKVAELTIIEERNRLARDIHDSLGHYLTVINVQLEKAMAFRDRNPQVADQAIRDAKRLSGEALHDIRGSVGALRDIQEPFSLIHTLTGLVKNMRSRQLTIELEIDGSEEGFSQQSLTTLYRAAQEGLTNIQKHAQAGLATISIKFESQLASLSITDNGQGFNPGIVNKNESHYGLQGVRERLELIRGSLELESAPGQGTSLSITVPRNPLTLMTVTGGAYERISQ